MLPSASQTGALKLAVSQEAQKALATLDRHSFRYFIICAVAAEHRCKGLQSVVLTGTVHLTSDVVAQGHVMKRSLLAVTEVTAPLGSWSPGCVDGAVPVFVKDALTILLSFSRLNDLDDVSWIT